jgi:hypothetical protein
MASMPHNQALINMLKRAGVPVVMLAVDDCDDQPSFDTWVQTKGKSFPAVSFVHIDPKSAVSVNTFKIPGYPTQFVIDQNGVIRTSFVGYAGPTDDLEKAVRAALVAGK